MRAERNCMVYLFSRWGLIEFIRWQCKIESKKCFLFKTAEIDKLEMILLWIAGFFRSFVCAASRQIIEINSTHTQRAQSKSICWLERLSEYFTIEPKNARIWFISRRVKATDSEKREWKNTLYDAEKRAECGEAFAHETNELLLHLQLNFPAIKDVTHIQTHNDICFEASIWRRAIQSPTHSFLEQEETNKKKQFSFLVFVLCVCKPCALFQVQGE